MASPYIIPRSKRRKTAFAGSTTTKTKRKNAAIGAAIAILIGVTVEERDLLAILGEDYRRYRARTPMLFPLPGRRAPEAKEPESTA